MAYDLLAKIDFHQAFAPKLALLSEDSNMGAPMPDETQFLNAKISNAIEPAHSSLARKTQNVTG